MGGSDEEGSLKKEKKEKKDKDKDGDKDKKHKDEKKDKGKEKEKDKGEKKDKKDKDGGEKKDKDKKDKDKDKKDKGKDEKGKDEKGKDKEKDKDKKEKKEKKDKDKDGDKDKKHKDEKKDKGKDKEKDKDEKKDKKDKDGGEKKDKDKKDKDKDKKDKGKDEKGKDEKGKDKEKDKDKKEKKDKKDKKDEDEDGEDGKKKKKDKDKDKAKDKDKKDKPLHPSGVSVNVPSGPVLGGEAASYYNPSGAPRKPPSQPGPPPQSGEAPWFLREPGTEVHSQPPPRADPPFPNPNPHYTTFQQPPPQQPSRAVGDCGGAQPPQTVPPSGYRIPLDPNAQFPTPDQLGRPPATDFNSSTGPIFIGSAIFPDSVHPCKIIPSLHPPCRVSHNGGELKHHGRYDLLPITLDMEWIPTGNGQIPPGRRPVEGGYESNGGKLYHALGTIQGVQVPGKAGERIRGASIPFGGSEHILQENYSILCWK